MLRIATFLVNIEWKHYYNSPDSLEQLLLSIPSLTEIEVVVVDDKSNKGLKKYFKIMENIKFKHVIFINNNTNKKGAGVCRNIGINIATGSWLLFADADGYFINGFYSKI